MRHTTEAQAGSAGWIMGPHTGRCVLQEVLAFCYKICREAIREGLCILKGIVHGGVGHAAGLKPAVEYVVDPPQIPFALLAGDGDAIDVMPVQVCHLRKAGNGAWTGDVFIAVCTQPMQGRPGRCIKFNLSKQFWRGCWLSHLRGSKRKQLGQQQRKLGDL